MAPTSATPPKCSDGPEPFSEDELKIIKAAQADFWFFLTHVYARSFEGLEFLYADGLFKPWSLGLLQKTWARLVAGDALPPERPPYSRWRIMAPRLHLKSTVLGHGYLFWRFFSEGGDVDALYIAYKKPLAEEHMEKLKRAIAVNPYTRFWRDNNPLARSVIDYTVTFNEQQEDGEYIDWRAQADPEGIMAASRGRHPKIVICDDILSDFANPLESTEIEHINQIFEYVVMSLPPVDGTLGVVGTPQSPNDILHKLQDNPQFFTAKFPAIRDSEQRATAWPEMFDFVRLEKIKNQVGDNAFEVEYQLYPRELANSFLSMEKLKACVGENLARLQDPLEAGAPQHWHNPEGWPFYGAMDVGKAVHPSHIVFFIESPDGWLLQAYEKWLDGADYNEQVRIINRLIEYFNPVRFYFDSTRSELEDRNLSKRAQGINFRKNIKASMATLLESRVNNSYNISVLRQDTGPGIIFFGPKDSRQIRSMLQVNKELEASESRDGHGDGFWSTALAVYARDQGPRMTNLGNVQEIFSRPAPMNDGLLFAPRALSFSCTHEFERLELVDRLRIRPTQIKYRCRFCLGLVDKLPPGYEAP